MKKAILPLLLFIASSAQAQYYYNDIIGTGDIITRMKNFKAARVQQVTAAGYDARGAKNADFSEWQEVQNNGSVLKVTTRNGQQAARLYYYFDEKDRLIRSRDSSAEIQVTTVYSYDGTGKITRLKTTTSDEKKDFDETEEHIWSWGNSGRPVKMERVVNGTDSTEYRFAPDQQGNVGDETMYRRYPDKDTVYYYIYENTRVYYYYDEQKRLTDIVRYNKKAKQLLPDVMFEYDDNNRVVQKITTVSGTSRDYFIWLYAYDERGLKTKEVLRNKFKELKGRIDYTYTFAP